MCICINVIFAHCLYRFFTIQFCIFSFLKKFVYTNTPLYMLVKALPILGKNIFKNVSAPFSLITLLCASTILVVQFEYKYFDNFFGAKAFHAYSFQIDKSRQSAKKYYLYTFRRERRLKRKEFLLPGTY